MTGSLSTRLAKLERSARGPKPYFLELPDDHLAWSSDLAIADGALRDAIVDHAARTGYTGKVLVGPPMCETEDEWDRLYGRGAAR